MSPGRLVGRLLVAAALCLGSLCPAHAQKATESLVYSFAGTTDSQVPAASLIQAGDGQLYGTTIGNFFTDYGSVYKLGLNGAYTTVYKFGGITDSATPFAPLYQAADGNLYSTTYGNLLFGTDGTVFSITPAGKLTTLYSFTGATDGANPEGGLVQLSDGTFFGATPNAATGYGTLFQIGTAKPLTTLISFNKFNGAGAIAAPVEGTDGNFYGVSGVGGASGFGSIYQLTPSGTLTPIYNFTGLGDGASPFGPLIEGPDGNFYGATGANGTVKGADKNGTIFRITTAGVLTTLHVMNPATDGSSPLALFLGGDGFLYGNTTSGGANSDGTIFRVSLTGTFTKLYDFATGDATAPQMGLVQASDGTFWGSGSSGAANSLGGVFKLTLSPAPPAPVTLTASASTISLGDPVTLTWTVTNAFSNTMRRCNASISPAPASAAGWSGTQPGKFDSTTNLWSGSTTITPAYPGVYTYGLTCGGTESTTATITVGNAAALTITTQSPLSTAYIGVPYAQTIGVSGGVQPYTFAVTVGSLPAGLALNPTTGAITGTPTLTDSSDFTVKVTDSDAAGASSATANLSIAVLQPLKLVTSSLPDGRLGVAYSQQLTASGGTAPYRYTLSPGSALPAGLTLSSGGLISGIPTAAATSNFAVLVSDSGSQSISANLTLTIDPLITTTGKLTLTPAAISVGGTTTASLTITAPAGSPAMTGTVQFTQNGQPIGSPVALTNGTASLTTPAFTTTGTVAVTAFYSGDANFLALGYPSANLTVSVAAQPALVIAPAVATVATGADVSVTATLANFASGAAVTMACSHLPTDVTCSFSNVTTTSATITIHTSTTSAALAPEPRTATSELMLCALPGVILLGLAGRRRRRSLHRLLMLSVVTLIGLSIAGCGSHTTIDHAGTGTSAITVTATAGAQTASAQLSLVVHN
ncbi:beta strand repeat-containing protein [Granulicella tundricola]|uniref:beta strand repeat-containing protein n=1 Tax=Granulicella tundricola TaxID=940615 RepID=UPI000321553B|nr:choice-of-anchor tandem repeat GloVer-containing protein [Granulicella tundricola]